MFPGKDLHIAVQYFLNADLKPELIRKQVRELASGGYKCIFGHARQGLITPYLSEGWWRAIDVIVEECEKLGIRFAIWDEDYYPSPSAGNRVMWDHPEFAAQQLKFTVAEAVPGRVRLGLEPTSLLGCYAVFEDGSIEDVTAFCGTICDQWNDRRNDLSAYSDVLKVGAPHWRASLSGRHYALDWEAPRSCRIVAAQIRRNFGGGHNVDLLNADAIRYFLHVTNEPYWKRYGEERFEKVFAGTFMDEPSVSGIFPWTGKLPELYRERFGEDLLAVLPHLAIDINGDSKPVRLRYRTLQQELLCQNYLGETQKWCAAHHIPSIGHLSRTEFLSHVNFFWPNELRCCKYLDLPCTDPLGANMGWPDTASYHTGLKVVSSAAYWFGKEQAGSDALAVCGNETGLRELQYMAEYQLVLGITWFNLHGAAVSWAGPRKDEVPPSLFYQHTQWSVMNRLWARLDGECQRLAQGREHVTSVVYYPAAQLTAGANGTPDRKLEADVHFLSEALLSAHKEFAFIDAVTLAEQQPEAFAKAYPFLVIPAGVTFFEPEAEAFFGAYRKAGGRILAPEEIGAIPGVCLSGAGAENVFVHRRELADGSLDAYLFNRAEETFLGTFEGKPVEVPPRSGCFAAAPRPAAGAVVAELRKWQVRFPENMVMLNRFTAPDANVDLRERRTLPPQENGVYKCRFMAQGTFSSLQFVADAEMCSAPWTIRVNGKELVPLRTGRFYDEANLFYDLLPVLRTGSVPTVNDLEVITSGVLAEPGYLLGSFRAEFRHGAKTLPYLKGADLTFAVEDPADWSTWGFGTFSGVAEYRTEFTAERSGKFRLALGRVESAASVLVDGTECATLLSPPYELDLELAAGKHALRLQVSNAPGNRDRLSDVPSGVLGPVRLLQLD